ncbi:MAG: DUF4131 domain-containing protein [Flavobacteriaceae bacterium]|nr:MAG: DUF4131 domain-containing protein [Flavobacteriaceae bacterium]
MKKLLDYLPFHFTLFLMLGILTQFYFKVWSFGFYGIIYTALMLLSILVILKKSTFYFLSARALFFYTGIVAVYIQDNTNYDSHYLNHFKEKSTVILAVKKMVTSGHFTNTYEASVTQVDTVKTRGAILLNIQKDSTNKRLKTGDCIFVKPIIKELIPPLNPYQFHYKSYLKKRGMTHQIFLEKDAYTLLKEKRFSLEKFASEIRSAIQRSLESYHFQEDELAVINALLLGQRQYISKELMDDYSHAGAIHILAVSGLHVGILLWMLSFVLKPLERIKNGKTIKTIFLIILLWAFALIAGLSASVVRAVTMFTFVAAALTMNRTRHILYAIIASLFFLLLIKPLFLFDVGFQLSYLAVFGIVWIQPKIYRIWKPKYKLIDTFWQLCTVSIGAQFGILPLTLYYFHQFPGLFMITNLVVIPFLGGVLITGMLLIILAISGALSEFLATLYGAVISLMNDFIRFISEQETFLITDISFSGFLMIIAYMVLIRIGVLFSKHNYKNLIVLLWFVCIFQGVLIFEKYSRESKKEFIVFHKSKNTILGIRQAGSLKVYHSGNLEATYKIIAPYKVGEGVSLAYSDTIPNFFQVEKPILIIDTLGIYQFKSSKNAIVILRQSTRIHLERLIKVLKPEYIIADGSNYKSMVLKWEETCLKNHIPFWYTGRDGAYIIKEDKQ